MALHADCYNKLEKQRKEQAVQVLQKWSRSLRVVVSMQEWGRGMWKEVSTSAVLSRPSTSSTTRNNEMYFCLQWISVISQMISHRWLVKNKTWMQNWALIKKSDSKSHTSRVLCHLINCQWHKSECKWMLSSGTTQ